MIPHSKFLKQPKNFWAQIKLVSMSLGYSKKNTIKEYKIEDIVDCLKNHDLSTDHLVDLSNKVTTEGRLLVEYFSYRAEALGGIARPNLMNRDQAKIEFEKIKKSYSSKVLIPLNKQKGDKRHPAYFTGIVNMLAEINLGSLDFDYNPRKLVIVTNNRRPLRTLSRWIDGAYPSTVNPIAVWEIKEYYGTKTFGSRVADGVYESLLDGYELEDLKVKEAIDIKHFLFVDDYFTWWECGKSYLCRLVDMLHEGYIDEVIFGREVLERWPQIVKSWPIITKSTIIYREHLLQS